MPDLETSKITKMLREWSDGDQGALNRLLPAIYDELHQLAKKYLRGERSGHTLQTTALVNEVYLKLASGRKLSFQDRTHFFAVAARAMRQILVDHARHQNRLKRGGANLRVTLDEGILISAEDDGLDIVALDQALERLARRDPEQAKVVDLKFFAGLTLDGTAEALGVSRSTVAREWESARAWLYRELTK